MTMPYANQIMTPSRPIREPKTSHAISAGKEKRRQHAQVGSDVMKAIVSEPVQKMVTTMTHRHRETPPSAIPRWLTPDNAGSGSARCLRLLSRCTVVVG